MKKYIQVSLFFILFSFGLFTSVSAQVPSNFLNAQASEDSRELLKSQIRALIFQLISQLQEELRSLGHSDSTYKQVSMESLLKSEKTIVYEYANNPCGTLMMDFTDRGSVSVGRGPVYSSALKVCQSNGSTMIPDDSSFRAYACGNIKIDNGPIFAQATFAFQCVEPAQNFTAISL